MRLGQIIEVLTDGTEEELVILEGDGERLGRSPASKLKERKRSVC